MKNLKVSSILISGAGGFLGNELLNSLAKYPHIRVFALSSRPDEVQSRHSAMANLNCIPTSDLLLGKVPFMEVDVVIHAAFARTVEFQKLANSLYFTQKLFEEAIKNGVAALINISSQSVYGRNADVPWVETTRADIDSAYALAKYSTELLIKAMCYASTTSFTSLRLSSLIGPGLNVRFLSRFVRNALVGEPINVINEDQIFSFMDVRDAAEGILSLLGVEVSEWNSVYNLGSHLRYTVGEIADMVAHLAKDYGDKPVVVERTTDGDGRFSGMDCSSFFAQTGWEPRFHLEQMIRTLFEYFLSLQNASGYRG